MTGSRPATTARFEAVDVARGVALVAMAIYHFAWDLSFYGLIATDIGGHPGWAAFARAIAGSFLALVGVSLVLALRGGFRAKPFLRRLAMVGGAALAITIVTWFAFPRDFIWFGILHCIAVSSVLGLAFHRLPAWTLAVLAALALAAPSFLAAPVFDAPALRWIGLMTYFPRTNDYVPLLPWFGMVLIGMAAAKAALNSGISERLARWKVDSRAAGILRWMGRHSLIFYLVHQPALLGALFLVTLIPGIGGRAEETAFLRQCEASCAATGSTAEICTAYCGCIAEESRDTDLWTPLTSGELTADQSARLNDLAGLCAAR
ncbi:heparan-alpha-glucosaminide N-acetyltransferase [Inquilinus sp. CAU 1745]|uniref:DUF1624 domain-containing protein n=1 Tax=Inquilinus sp. CAU 1745 TaxID=3140369 RepID=UPI00325C0202